MNRPPLPFLALMLVVAGFFAPLALRGHVIFAHDNRAELGLPPAAEDELPSNGNSNGKSNRKFSDQSSYYVPEIHHHLNGDRSGWISTWNPHVQMGRPSSHLSGFSPAFLPSRVLGWLTHDPFVFYTWLAVLTTVLTAVFGWLFLRALEVHPWAAFAGASTLACGVFSSYWLTFVMFLGGTCWTLGSAWLVVRLLQKPTPARALGLAFCVHALLLTAYPQQIVWHAYLLAAFSTWRWWISGRAVRPGLAVLAGVAAGFLCAAPVYLDLAIASARSARLDVDPEFFKRSLPVIPTLDDALVFASQWFDASWIGDPIAPSYPRIFSGACLAPLFAALFLIAGLEGGWRRAGLWLGFSAICVCLTLVPGAYFFAVEHLGLGFSRFLPLAAAWIPMIVAGTLTLDHVLTNGFRHPWRACLVAAVGPCVALVAVIRAGAEREPVNVGLGLALCAGLGVLLQTRKQWLVPLLVAISILAGPARLVLSRSRDAIATSSALVERLRTLTSDGSRFAFVGPRLRGLLPPNQEALLGLRSPRSYDSLSPLAYQTFVKRLSREGTLEAGRHFGTITDESRLGDAVYGYTGISTFVSVEPLQSAAIVDAGALGPLRVYRSREPAVRVAQFAAFDSTAAGDVLLPGRASQRPTLPSEILEEHDDLWRVRVTPASEPTLLFTSTQWHPSWSARVTGGDSMPVETPTACAEGFFLSVVVPLGTTAVELRFEPWARWMWLVHAALATAALAVAVHAWRRRRIRPV